MFGELMGSAEGLMSLLVILFMLAMGIGMGVWFFFEFSKVRLGETCAGKTRGPLICFCHGKGAPQWIPGYAAHAAGGRISSVVVRETRP
jgi:hypothetical protein